VGVVHEPVEDGVSYGAIPEIALPLIQRQLAGDERCGAVVAIFEHFQQIAHGGIGQRIPEGADFGLDMIAELLVGATGSPEPGAKMYAVTLSYRKWWSVPSGTE
jgi:hypothetical protein